jgi:hypothetical protein
MSSVKPGNQGLACHLDRNPWIDEKTVDNLEEQKKTISFFQQSKEGLVFGIKTSVS